MNKLERQLAESLAHLTMNKYPSDLIKDNIFEALEEKNRSKRIRHRFVKRALGGIAVITLIFSLIITSAFMSPAIAEVVQNIPLIGSIFNFMGDDGLKEAENQGFVSTINQSSRDQGICITINDVLYDEGRIVLSFTETCKGDFKNFLGMNNDILINNKLAPSSGMGISQIKIGEGAYVGLLDISIPDFSATADLGNDPRFFSGKIPDDFTLGLKISEIEGVKGTWNFDIPISKEKSQAATKVFKPEISKKYKQSTVSLNKVIFSPSCVGLTFTIKPFGSSDISTYCVYDEQGNKLEVISDSIEDPLYLPVKHIPEELKIIPYTTSTISVRKPMENKFPVTISQGDTGKVIIQKIDFFKDKTLIYYDFKGKKPSVEPNRIKIESKDEVGNYIIEGFPKGPGEKLKKPVKVKENSYIQEYKVIDATKDLYIYTTENVEPKPIKELEMTVPLK